MKHRICVVEIFSYSKGYVSRIKLDTQKYDNIGDNEKSLNDFMVKFILDRDEWYNIVSDKNFTY